MDSDSNSHEIEVWVIYAERDPHDGVPIGASRSMQWVLKCGDVGVTRIEKGRYITDSRVLLFSDADDAL